MMNVPSRRGAFTFSAPYGAQAIRLTDVENAPGGCEPRMYPYWSAINNHAGEPHFYAVVGRKGDRPLLLKVNKSTFAIEGWSPDWMQGTAEGWYFSDTLPHALYMIQGNRLVRYDVVTERLDTVFTLERRYGDALWQAHSSADDATHSATTRSGDFTNGCVVYREDQQTFYPAQANYDECQIDKSGWYLVIQEDNNNRFVEVDKKVTRYVSNAEGAVGHCDVGHQFVVGEDDQHEPGALVRWNLRVWGERELIWQAPGWGPGMGHVAVRGDLALLSSNWSGELLAISLSDRSARQVAPGMMAGEGYDYQLRASLDPLGEWCCWVSNVGDASGRLDAFAARVGAPGTVPPVVVQPPTPPVVNPPTPGGHVKTLTIFTAPEDAAVHLRHDSGAEFDAAPGMADGRPAHLFSIDDELVSRGHGAELIIDWQGKKLVQHGFLRPSPSGQAEFIGDVFNKPEGF